MLISIPFGFLRKCGPAIYSDINRYEDMLSSGKLSPTLRADILTLYFREIAAGQLCACAGFRLGGDLGRRVTQ